jgi:hypothetical protein
LARGAAELVENGGEPAEIPGNGKPRGDGGHDAVAEYIARQQTSAVGHGERGYEKAGYRKHQRRSHPVHDPDDAERNYSGGDLRGDDLRVVYPAAAKYHQGGNTQIGEHQREKFGGRDQRQEMGRVISGLYALETRMNDRRRRGLRQFCHCPSAPGVSRAARPSVLFRHHIIELGVVEQEAALRRHAGDVLVAIVPADIAPGIDVPGIELLR